MRIRIGLVTAALAGIAGLAALLAWQAARSAAVHRYTAARVMADYTALGADAVANRVQGFLGGRLYPLLGAIADKLPARRSALLAGMDPSLTDAAKQILWSARVRGDGSLATAVYDTTIRIDPALADSLRSAARRLPSAAYMGMVRQGNQLVIFSPLRGQPPAIAAYAIRLADLGMALARPLARDPILPASLTHGATLGDEVGFSLTIDGHHILARGTTDPSAFRALRSLGPMYGGMTVEVRLAQSLAPTLLIGGLPRSNMPFLLGAMALTLLLAIAVVLQLRQKERLARLREDFVAGASHELRTPLSQIRLFAETLRLERLRSDEERSRAITVIEREARRLQHLVENMLHFSRAERGTLRLAPEQVDLAALTREIVAEFTPLAEKAEVRLQVEGAESLSARVDRDAWRQVVLNLLDNAVKYGGRGSRVVVHVAAEGGSCRLTIADEGPGIPAADRARIWDRFWRGEKARADGIAGTGIGLATVRDLLTLHGGDCSVESGELAGARFIVRVPVAGP